MIFLHAASVAKNHTVCQQHYQYEMRNKPFAGFVFQIIYKIKKGCVSDETGTEHLTAEQVCERIFQEVDVNSDGMSTAYSKPTKSSNKSIGKIGFLNI